MTREKESGYKKFHSNFGKYIEKIREKTLLGDFWGKNGAVSYQRKIINCCKAYCRRDNKLYLESFSMFSSTYYAANGNALSHIGQANLFSKPLWCWRAWRCLRKAEKYSDEFARLKPMEDMTLGELDVRACVLNKAGRRSEATSLLSHGIMKILTGQIGTKHDLCLFLIHEAEVIIGIRKYDKENKAEKNYQQAMKLSEDEAVPALTKVRVMKSYGKFLVENKRIDEAESVLGDALDLARDNKLYDQERKIKAIFETFKLAIR